MGTLLITGGTGAVASLVRPHLRAAGHELVLFDLAPPSVPTGPGECFRQGSIEDMSAVASACATADGPVDLVIHLACHRSERPWPEIVATNVDGTRAVLEASRQAGVRRLLLASSVHAVGYLSVAETAEAFEPIPRPDTYYGLSKVVLEALGRLYADRFALTVVSARLGTVEARPSNARSLSMWLSPADLARLVEAVLALDRPGGHVVWGVSNNTRRWVSLAAGHSLGFNPVDDAEFYLAALKDDPGPFPAETLLGGHFIDADHPLGKSW